MHALVKVVDNGRYSLVRFKILVILVILASLRPSHSIQATVA